MPSETNLPPSWCDFANAKSEDRLGLFKDWVQSELRKMGESYIEDEPQASFVKKLTSVDWIMHNTDSLGAGSLCNAFHFTDSDIDALQRIDRAINLIQSGSGSILLADADSMFVAKLNLPTDEISLHCIHCLEASFKPSYPLATHQ